MPAVKPAATPRALRNLIGRAGTDSKPGVKCATLHLLPSLDILLERCEGQ